MNHVHIDPVTLDIVKDALIAVSNEVFYAFAQTSMSPIIYETLDYASGITDADGNLLTQGNGACGFIGTISPLVQDTIKKHGKENMRPGDVFIINDPYMGGGTHLSDIGMCMPVFFEGELIAFVGNKAHWTDVGGTFPGSYTMKATEMYQEGLCFPCVKLVSAGELVRGVYEVFQANVRYPELNEGDMWGQISSLRTGSNRLGDLCSKYGIGVVKGAMIRLLDQGEHIARSRLKEMPKGTWEMTDYMDDDGYGNPVKIQVKVTITDDEFLCDFTGSSPQVASTINAGYTASHAGVKIVYMAILGPALSVNDGIFRPLRVITEEGSVLKANRPAPTSCYFESMLYSTEVVWRALAPLFPEYLGAGHMLSVCACNLSGQKANGEPFLVVEPTGGGWGASRGKDGEVGQFCIGDGETYNVPVEMAESRYGIMVDEYSLHTDGTGAGEFRGGSGCVRVYRALTDNQAYSANFGRNKLPVWGSAGGKDGSYNYFEFFHADGTPKDERRQGIVSQYRLDRGETVRMVCATGGGYGDPMKRDPEKVAWDAKNGYITIAQAEAVYGVLLNPKTFMVDGLNRTK